MQVFCSLKLLNIKCYFDTSSTVFEHCDASGLQTLLISSLRILNCPEHHIWWLQMFNYVYTFVLLVLTLNETQSISRPCCRPGTALSTQAVSWLTFCSHVLAYTFFLRSLSLPCTHHHFRAHWFFTVLAVMVSIVTLQHESSSSFRSRMALLTGTWALNITSEPSLFFQFHVTFMFLSLGRSFRLHTT